MVKIDIYKVSKKINIKKSHNLFYYVLMGKRSGCLNVFSYFYRLYSKEYRIIYFKNTINYEKELQFYYFIGDEY